MGSRKLRPEELDRISELAKSWGKVVVRPAFGEAAAGRSSRGFPPERSAAARRVGRRTTNSRPGLGPTSGPGSSRRGVRPTSGQR
jgi:hypothetical protein